jgi:hypothetical protein
MLVFDSCAKSMRHPRWRRRFAPAFSKKSPDSRAKT